MKLMVVSDIHGSAYYCEKMLECYKNEKADKLVMLGDVLYHGPRNDLPKEYAPKKVIEMLNDIKEEVLCVRGNCDTEVDQMVLEFPILADYAILSLDGLTVYATHGHNYNTKTPPPLAEGDILLHGHTHVIRADEFGNKNTYINPGSITLPKENCPRSYIVYKNRKFDFYDIEGNIVKTSEF